MTHENVMDKLRTFFGLRSVVPPSNDFRNPIWGSDDDDDGDELYTKQQNMEVYGEMDIHQEITKHMHDVLKSFGSMLGDMKSFFHDEHFDPFNSITDSHEEAQNFNSNAIRDYYLKPGYHNHRAEDHKDIDMDGKISSNQISGLLKRKEDTTAFDGSLVPGRSFCQTIITTSVTKADGSIETRKIVKNGNEVIEETTTSTTPDARGPVPHNPGLNTVSSTGIILSELGQLFRNFY